MPPVPRQLALALDHTESYARDDFLPGPSNADALGLVDSWPDWPANAIALVGPEGSGKTHVATIWSATSGARVISAHALSEMSLPSALATGALVVEDAAVMADEEYRTKLLADAKRIVERWTAEGFFGKRAAIERNSQHLHKARRPDL